VLAVTFTNKAAREMRQRTERILLGPMAEGLPWLGTFHAISPRCCAAMPNWSA
jgi:DNA helicase II / ATP-dependent DNA helicase PcrA